MDKNLRDTRPESADLEPDDLDPLAAEMDERVWDVFLSDDGADFEPDPALGCNIDFEE